MSGTDLAHAPTKKRACAVLTRRIVLRLRYAMSGSVPCWECPVLSEAMLLPGVGTALQRPGTASACPYTTSVAHAPTQRSVLACRFRVVCSSTDVGCFSLRPHFVPYYGLATEFQY
eukprot:771146-Rhodomonas_salina.2